MSPSASPAARPRRLLRLALAVLLLGLLGGAAAWSWSAYHVSVAADETAAGRLVSAWEHLEQARRTWPIRADAHLLAARVARRLGKIDEAHTHLEAHERCGGDADGRAFEQTLLLVQEGEGELAGQDDHLLELVRDNHPQAPDILEALAQRYLKTNQPGGLPRLLELWSDRFVTSCWRGKVHYQLGHVAEAVADLAPFVAQQPDWDELRFELAQACSRAGHAGDALQHWRHLQRRDPDSPDVLHGLAMCLQDLSRLDEAAAALDHLLEQHPLHPAGLVERARVAFRQDQPELGERLARRAIDSNRAAVDAYLILALCLDAQGRADEARQQRRRWQGLDAAQYHLGLIMPQLGRFPNDARLHHEAGSSFLLLGNQQMAIEALGQALRIDPHHRPTHRLLAEYYTTIGDRERAKGHQRAAAP